ncbi:MAG: nickel-type superoxide dismutase maturation protease [Acidimicrobiales bacterium]
MIADPAVTQAASELARWALGRRRRVRVVGASMAPTLAEGEFVLVEAAAPFAVGDLVVARHPHDPTMDVVKRVAAVRPDGTIELASDNPARGTDSSTWGPVAPGAVTGRVTLVLDRPLGSLAPPGARSGRPSPLRWLRR